jgi:hypothetical protein
VPDAVAVTTAEEDVIEETLGTVTDNEPELPPPSSGASSPQAIAITPKQRKKNSFDKYFIKTK